MSIMTDKTEFQAEQYKKALDTAPYGVFVIDGDGRYVDVNAAALQLTGYSREELLGMTVADLVVPDNADKARRGLDTLQTDQNLKIRETSLRCKDGTICHVTLDAVRLGDDHFIGFCSDLSAHKETVEALRASEEKFRKIVDHIPGTVWAVDERLVFTLSLGAGLPDLGLEPNQIVGVSLEEFFGTSDPEFVPLAMHRRALAGESVTYEIEFGGRTYDSRLQPLRDSTGKVTGVLGIAFDVSERIEAERQQRLLQEQLQHRQKLESLGVLAGGIAHDFNNLLSAMLGNIELALLDLPKDAPATDAIRIARTTVIRAADLVWQMLAYAGSAPRRIESVALSATTEEMGEMLSVAVSKRARLEYDLARDLPFVRADVAQIRQIVLNLITNASEALGDTDGTVKISTAVARGDIGADPTTTTIGTVSPDRSYVSLTVTDSGCGMDPETRARVFEPFFTTKVTGRGLGLATVAGIVSGHDGIIRLRSEPGAGTTVTVWLPIDDTDPATTEATPEPAPAAEDMNLRVLLVDDEEVVLEVGTQMLERLGAEVIAATNGREAVDLFAVHHADIDCVVLDMTMPVMDGVETVAELRRIDQNVRVLVVSGYAEANTIEKFPADADFEFIHKPFGLGDLRRALRKTMQH